MLIPFFNLIFAAIKQPNFAYQPLINSEICESDESKWFDEMVQIYTVLNNYMKKVNNESRIHFAMFAFLSSLDVFKELLKMSSDTKIIRPWKRFFTDDDKENFLIMLENDLKKKKIPISNEIIKFLHPLYLSISFANEWKSSNWAYFLLLKGLKLGETSLEEKIFLKNFVVVVEHKLIWYRNYYSLSYTRNSILRFSKGKINDISFKNYKVLGTPNYLFSENLKKVDFIEQELLERIEKLRCLEDVYEIVAIFLENSENSSKALLIKKDDRWATFSEDKCEWKNRIFPLPWHVTFIMYKKIKSE